MTLRHLDLEALILANPDSPDGYILYSDWLQQHGDPRGEFIAVQLARESQPHDASIADRERELLTKHESTWLRGLTDKDAWWPRRPITVRWRRGFVHAASIETSNEVDDPAMVYRELVSLPCASLLRELRIGVACSYPGEEADDLSIIEALRDEAPSALRKLTLDCFDDQLSWTHVGDLSVANASLRDLESLAIVAGRLTLGKIDLPKLRSLRIETGGLRAHVLESIAAAAWPELESLVIYFGTRDYGGTCTPDDLAAILDGANLPRLTTLGLCNSEFADELAELVATSRILPRLARLDLSKGTLGDAGAHALIANARAFRHLERLDLSENFLTEGVCAEIRKVLSNADVSRQKAADGYGRFVSVSE